MDAGPADERSCRAACFRRSFLFRYADEKAWDILLQDIEMGAMDGVQLAKKFRQTNQVMQLVFITGFPDFMTEGYEVFALHYLMKPVRKENTFIRSHSKGERFWHSENFSDIQSVIRIV